MAVKQEGPWVRPEAKVRGGHGEQDAFPEVVSATYKDRESGPAWTSGAGGPLAAVPADLGGGVPGVSASACLRGDTEDLLAVLGEGIRPRFRCDAVMDLTLSSDSLPSG